MECSGGPFESGGYAKASSGDGSGEVPEYLMLLVKRLGSFEMRNLYIRALSWWLPMTHHISYLSRASAWAARFIPDPLVITYVGSATTQSQAANTVSNSKIKASSLSPHLLSYKFEALLVGITVCFTTMWVDGGRSVYMAQQHGIRPALALALALPLLITSRLPLLLLPPLLPIPVHSFPTPANPDHIIPAPSLPDPSLSIQTTLSTLNTTMTRLRLLKYTQAALMCVPELPTQAGEWWEKGKREGDWIRGDEEVRRVARGVGLAYENKREVNEMLDEERVVRPKGEGKKVVEDGVEIPEEGGLRTSARQAVGTLKKAYVPSQYW
ncbi:hypothetical protein BDN72DRAFT_857283 [Pluteus cervinus]|uniref:Uncharacterized protein n=1 Tax=Pluteus cervinus TaxID=181527 RepID=A0ACD3AXG0_9AGAR|nr:hypothetical protein BDN72DRAFT_857283 [Pluteus cervinus]